MAIQLLAFEEVRCGLPLVTLGKVQC
jgi:hypothetical protein